MFSLACPNCGATLTAEKELAGKSTFCTECGTSVPVPADSSSQLNRQFDTSPIGVEPQAHMWQQSEVPGDPNTGGLAKQTQEAML